MKKGILLALMALSLVLGSSVAAQAAELTSSVPAGRNINDHVTSLTIQSAQLQDGQIQSGADLSVQGTFSDEKGPIKNGDVIQVDWPHDQTAYLTGYSGQKSLYLAGVNVADYVVSAERARLVFNANVEQLKQVQGSFSFAAKVYNQLEQAQVVAVVVGDQQTEVTVAGQPTDSGGREVYDQSWRGEKVGGTTPWQGANWVNWGVYLNSNHAQLAGPIDLSDEIPAGLALDPTTVTLTVDGQTSYRLDEITTAYPASQLTVTGNRLQAHLSAAEFSGHQVLLGYLTRILTTAGTEFVNQVTGTYQLPGQAQQGFTYQTQVRNVAFDATVTGVRPGNLKIIKQYQDGAERKPLAEATFVIINPVTTQVWVEKTNAQGIIELTNVPAGTYVVREIAAPAFIDLTKVKDQEWQIQVSASEVGQALVIVNEKKPVDEVDQGTGTDEATTTDPVETTDAATEGTPGIDAGVGTDEILTHDEGTSPEPGVEVGTDPLEVPTVDAGSQTEAGSVAVGTQTDAPDQSNAGTTTDDLMIDESTGTDPIDTSDATTEMASGVDADTSTEPVETTDAGTGTSESVTTGVGTDEVPMTDAGTEMESGIDAGTSPEPIETTETGTGTSESVTTGVGTDEVSVTDTGTEMESGIDAGTSPEPIETTDAGTGTDESVTTGMESGIDVVTNPEPIETTVPETETGTSVVRTEPAMVTNNEGALTSGTPTRETGMTVRVKQAGASQTQATGTQASLPQTGPTTAWLSSLSGWGLLGLLGTQRKRRLQ